ncbi:MULTISPECIES: hypothetical protein [Dehalobacter]|uniref:Uncharacterized protein n=1 Tax=Dehalobacter restrictus TaxID=55583 RepID=A0A857DGP0_9FIRM|nr:MULTISPECIES: hypothetical protein [Dehalobacter]MCG1026182.1 hypothetical protein [Dehalobacter sp.]OCZ53514.1 hypothetical protein A7D23_08185 [Dehalobacter sp. TeCB1]OCZ53518.1 hypothetical protein A7D23_08210 [Dehalobacter sp. TeCB1]QHA00474.1 hypothetical protein GQ588_07450 [Dehalobacter restrictus]RJE48050.1 hypothetical protein A7K50_00535 [Dehalobacter sp. MCB1]
MIALGPIEIMNHTPWHFLAASVLLVLFFIATFSDDQNLKTKLRKIMYVVFGFAVLTGCYVWTLVDFSLPLLIKSIGGFALFWVMIQLTKNRFNKLYWGLFILIAAVGLTLAFVYI